MSDRHDQRAKEILAKIKYATLATVTPEGLPWNTPVAHEIDSDYNIYWFSDKENQHSKNVRNNPHVFIVIYDSTAPAGQGEGVYIDADVMEMTDVNEINKIRNAKKGKNDADNFLGNAVRRCYKAIPKKIWMNDSEEKDGDFIRDYRVEVSLK